MAGEEANFQRPLVDPRNHPDARNGRMFIPYRQELPPKGGYPDIKFFRYRPWRHNGYYIWGTFLLVTLWGNYKIYQGCNHIRERYAEKRTNRIALIPYLQAETDHFYRLDKDRWNEYEATVMADVEGWKIDEPVYKTGKFVPNRVQTKKGVF